MSLEHTENHEHGEAHEGMTRKKIWVVFAILLAVTVVEFFIALYLVPGGHMKIETANPVYILLTLFKAYYIVAFFMHLKFEKAGLIYSLVVPILFIIGLILVLTNESHHWIALLGR